MNISYEWLPSGYLFGNKNCEKLINECSQLYSTQYGKWSNQVLKKAGKSITLSHKRISEWLKNDNTAIYYAKDDGMLIGYAIAIQLNVQKYGIISWVTQLVVHENYRHHNIAKSLLHSIWGFSDNYAWGIISANPYAIRALEKTTRRRSDPKRIKHNLRKIISIGIQNVPYINEKTKTYVTSEVSKINTEFFVDHSDIEKMIDDVVTDSVPWKLGTLDEGWEWLAFTFNDQLPFDLSEEEIQTMLDTSDKVVQNAYNRMDISETHQWINNTINEVDFIYRECNLCTDSVLVDYGCGQGRHSLQLAKRGVTTIGIDYIANNIEIAESKKKEQNIENVTFVLGDCRYKVFEEKADAVICIYDVIGTYADNDENIKILETLYRTLKQGGTAIISVMNYKLTELLAKHKFSLKDDPNALVQLKPSNIMELNGNIFDPDYYLLDTDTGVVYRREQFRKGNALPVELIVRDKRFLKDEIVEMCEATGFTVEYAKFVNARDWETGFSETYKSAKEILIKCRKL